MICDLITKAICQTSSETDAVDKYVAGEEMSLEERFVLAVAFSGPRIADFLDDENQEKAMEIHDTLAECILNLSMFGGVGLHMKEEMVQERPGSATYRKSATMFRVRKTNITVSRQPLLKNESLLSKNMPTSQLTRPGTGDSINNIRLKPFPKTSSMMTTPGTTNLHKPPSPFTIPFTARQDLQKHTGTDSTLILASLVRRFTSSIHQTLADPVIRSIDADDAYSLASTICVAVNRVKGGLSSSDVQIVVDRCALAKLADVNVMLRMQSDVNVIDVLAYAVSAKRYGNLQDLVIDAKDLESLKGLVKSANEVHQTTEKITVIDLVASIIAFRKILQVCTSTKILDLSNIVLKKDKGKKVCLWLAKSVSAWGKSLSQFCNQNSQPDSIFKHIQVNFDPYVAKMKHFLSFLKLASAITTVPQNAVLNLNYYLLENQDAFSHLINSK